MVARTLDTTRGEAAMWTVRCAGLGGGLLVVLGAILLGWLAWPALVGGVIGGGALIALLARRERASCAGRGVAQIPSRGIREQAPATAAESDTRVAA